MGAHVRWAILSGAALGAGGLVHCSIASDFDSLASTNAPENDGAASGIEADASDSSTELPDGGNAQLSDASTSEDASPDAGNNTASRFCQGVDASSCEDFDESAETLPMLVGCDPANNVTGGFDTATFVSGPRSASAVASGATGSSPTCEYRSIQVGAYSRVELQADLLVKSPPVGTAYVFAAILIGTSRVQFLIDNTASSAGKTFAQTTDPTHPTGYAATQWLTAMPIGQWAHVSFRVQGDHSPPWVNVELNNTPVVVDWPGFFAASLTGSSQVDVGLFYSAPRAPLDIRFDNIFTRISP